MVQNLILLVRFDRIPAFGVRSQFQDLREVGRSWCLASQLDTAQSTGEGKIR